MAQLKSFMATVGPVTVLLGPIGNGPTSSTHGRIARHRHPISKNHPSAAFGPLGVASVFSLIAKLEPPSQSSGQAAATFAPSQSSGQAAATFAHLHGKPKSSPRHFSWTVLLLHEEPIEEPCLVGLRCQRGSFRVRYFIKCLWHGGSRPDLIPQLILK